MVLEHREPHLLTALENIFQIVLVVRLLCYCQLIRHITWSVMSLELMATRNHSECKILRLVLVVRLSGAIQAKRLLKQVQFAKLSQLRRY
jgi:hypothetical protein